MKGDEQILQSRFPTKPHHQSEAPAIIYPRAVVVHSVNAATALLAHKPVTLPVLHTDKSKTLKHLAHMLQLIVSICAEPLLPFDEGHLILGHAV